MCCACLFLGIGLGTFGEVSDQAVNELLLLFLALVERTADEVGYICSFLHVLVQGHQHLVDLLQERTNIRHLQRKGEQSITG